MILSDKMRQLLKRRKEQVRAECSCKGGGCTNCAAKFDIYLKLAAANVPTKFWDFEFDKLETVQEPTKSKVAAYIKKLDEAYEKGIGLYCFGSNGVGKTLCTSLILKEAIRKGYSARFTNLSEAISILSDAQFDKQSGKNYKQEIIEVDFLVLDDLTKLYKNVEKQTSVYVDSLFDQLFRTRANSCLPTLITANATREEAITSKEETFALGLLSLFAEHLLDVHFLGKDVRNQQRKINEAEFFEA